MIADHNDSADAIAALNQKQMPERAKAIVEARARASVAKAGGCTMSRDDIIRMMGEVGAGRSDRRPKNYDGFVDVFQRFTALISAAEREACANISDGYARLREAARNVTPEMHVKFAAGCAMDTARSISEGIRARTTP